MLYTVDGKIKTKEQLITKVYNRYVAEYRSKSNKKEKEQIISEIIDEIEYINYFNQDNSETKEKELNDLLSSYQKRKFFSKIELNDIFSIIEKWDIIRN